MAKKRATKTNKSTKKADMVRIYLPYIDGEEEEITVGVNGKLYKVQRGGEVEVPKAVATVIRNSHLQAKVAKEFRDSVRNVNMDA